MHYLGYLHLNTKMHTQGIITLHVLLTTLNTTKRKIGSLQETKKAINRAIKRKSQCEDDLQNPPQLLESLVMDKEYLETFLGGIDRKSVV